MIESFTPQITDAERYTAVWWLRVCAEKPDGPLRTHEVAEGGGRGVVGAVSVCVFGYAEEVAVGDGGNVGSVDDVCVGG